MGRWVPMSYCLYEWRSYVRPLRQGRCLTKPGRSPPVLTLCLDLFVLLLLRGERLRVSVQGRDTNTLIMNN